MNREYNNGNFFGVLLCGLHTKEQLDSWGRNRWGQMVMSWDELAVRMLFLISNNNSDFAEMSKNNLKR